ncbi:MAG: twin-arginine translocation signal domain-containing protein [Gammaproteobacteria bacterium]
MSSDQVSRRGFLKLCASTGALVAGSPSLLARASPERVPTPPTTLLNAEGTPLRLDELVVGDSYVFHYPYVTTPCFLIDLGKTALPQARLEMDDGRSYQWRGGVGPRRSVVAFSAICAHRMTYPTPSVSFIHYRHEAMPFTDNEMKATQREQVIYCCSEGSVYDPAEGCRVLGGPAPQPLAAIDLALDEETGELRALGTYGGDMFERFFEQFGFQLALQQRRDNIREPVGPTTKVVSLKEYSLNTNVC